MNPLPDDPPSIEALFGGQPPPPRAVTLEELDRIVENSSEKNRNFFIAYLGLLIYVQAIVFSTTDLQLLVSTEGLRLPIIDLNVPLVGFYVVVPIFIIALHFNFLQNLESHHYKLMRWQEAHPDGQVPRSRIQPFLFDYAVLERGSLLEPWVRAANTLLVLNLAPITLGLLLLRYSDRQDGWVTVWHWLAFFFDTYLVWKLRLALDRNRTPDRPPPRRRYWREIHRHGLRGAFGLFLLFEMGLTLATAWLPSETFTDHVLPFARGTEGLESKVAKGILSFAKDRSLVLPAWLKEFLGTFKDGENTRLASWLLPRIAIDPNDTVWKPDEKALETEARLAGETDWVKYFNARGTGFRSSTLHLRLARLPWQRLPRADFSYAQLEEANLTGAQFQGASLLKAQLQGAQLWWSQLQGVNFAGAQLQGTKLVGAELQGANLDDAQRQNADFTTLPRFKTISANLTVSPPPERQRGASSPEGWVLPDLCRTKQPRESRLAAVRSIRRNYHALETGLRDNSELQSTLTEIDRTLCTLPACADLKDDIEGLDCGPFAGAKKP